MARNWGSRYLLRFDDLCPTMNWQVWNLVEMALDHHGIRPMVAVVPDNQDPELIVDTPSAGFWTRVRSWQDKGWSVGLHGYQHRYVTTEAGLIGLNPRSEFAGLSAAEQRTKLVAGLDIFRDHGIRPQLWIAPGHSFDRTTVVLLAELGITAISDGFHFLPHTDVQGITWIPQQIWRLRRMPPGIWTVCLHHNAWTDWDLELFNRDLEVFHSRITSLPEVLSQYQGRSSRLAPLVHRLLLCCITAKRSLRLRSRLGIRAAR